MYKWINTENSFGIISILLHWLMAIALIGLFILGITMVELDYYNPWYHKSLDIHKAVGVIVAMVLLFRLIWKVTQPSPRPLDKSHIWMNRIATLAHGMLYVFMTLLVISGYLLSTSEGKGVDVFGLFEFPALFEKSTQRGEWAGNIHEILAYTFIAMVALHAAAAFYHHFFLKDKTLKRMLRRT